MSFANLRGKMKHRAWNREAPNKSQQIREILLEGACTAEELSIELGWARHQVNWGLYGLRVGGDIHCVGKARTGQTGLPLKMWDLTPKGRRIARWRHRLTKEQQCKSAAAS